MRELYWMVMARQEVSWHQTASVITMIAEVNRDRKARRKPFESWEFMPGVFARKAKADARKHRRQSAIPAPITVLKAFVPGAT